MPNLRFEIKSATLPEHSASPLIALGVEARSNEKERIENILLRVQVRIDAARRAHSESEQARICEVFGQRDVWSRSSKSLLWTQETVVVPAFESKTTFEVYLPCSYDFASAASKYLHGLETGSVPIVLAFSGTVFHKGETGLTATPLPWDGEASYALPLHLIRGVIDQHFPDSAIVGLGRDVFERLNRYRREHGLRSWTDAVGQLLTLASNGGRS